MSLELISDYEYVSILKNCERYFKSLAIIAQASGEAPEGSILYQHMSHHIDTTKDNLRKNLISLAKVSNNILEIGFNMGHSAVLMLVSNPNAKITCFDICSHKYVDPCYMYLKMQFKDRITLVKGSSTETVPTYRGEQIDLAHIDGCHDGPVAYTDFMNTIKLVKQGGYVVFDDTWFQHLRALWDSFVSNNYVENVTIHESNQHSIGRKIMETCTEPISTVYTKNSDIAICSLSAGSIYKTKVKYGIQTRAEYCKKHGYDFREDEDDKIIDTTRPLAWSKINLILRCLEDGYNYVVWIDADTFIMNNTIPIQFFIDNYLQNKDILVTKDYIDLINSGVMFIKNTEWSKTFFTELYNQTDFIHSANWEQDAIEHMYKTNILDSAEHIVALDREYQKLFNSYHFMYTSGDFIVHLAGCWKHAEPEANQGLEFMMNRFCPVRMENDSDDSFKQRLESLGISGL
jgi:predicted O-methyltransferase YrrM